MSMKTKNEDKKSGSKGVEKLSSREPELKTRLQCPARTQLLTPGPSTLYSSTLKVERTKRECL